MNKHRILKALKDAPEDIKSMTVGALVDKWTKEQEKQDKEELDANNKIIEEFSGVYIKVRDENVFGPEVSYIRIDEISVGSMTTDWERLYDIKGEKVQFSNVNNALIELGSAKNREDHLSAKELRDAEIITKEDFETAHNHLKTINEIIDKVKA